MKRSTEQMRRDALQIWRAGVDAVRSETLMRVNVSVDNNELRLGNQTFDLDQLGRIVVVGGGKAGTGMAQTLEKILGPTLLKSKRVMGWMNIPEGCVRPMRAIYLHPARPAGSNEPTEAGVEGTSKILSLVQTLGPEDLCICLISGGGSALLPAPVPEISLDDKLKITQFLSSSGATIQEMNTVRKQLSLIKGGGLARACTAGNLVSLIISDVIGDPLDIIASGPTIEDHSTPQDALEVLEKFKAKEKEVAPAVIDYLENKSSDPPSKPTAKVANCVIGNNAVAVRAAGVRAQQLGYTPEMYSAVKPEGQAEDIGRELAVRSLEMRKGPGADCLISGGEPVVTLAPEEDRGKGGRNQQLVLAALDELLPTKFAGVTILSGGTDGEDGPTNAAGALCDPSLAVPICEENLDPKPYLAHNNAYHFFEKVNNLVFTGPTHTNVMDLRVVLVDRME